MNICDHFQILITQMSSTFHSVCKLKYRNWNLFFHLLILLSCDISSNPEPTHQHNLEYLNKWNNFKIRGFQSIHHSINSLLLKFEELLIIAKSNNAVIIGMTETKLDESPLELEIQVDNYKILWCGRNMHRGGVACYIRNDFSYNSMSIFPRENESIFLEIFFVTKFPFLATLSYLSLNDSYILLTIKKCQITNQVEVTPKATMNFVCFFCLFASINMYTM